MCACNLTCREPHVCLGVGVGMHGVDQVLGVQFNHCHNQRSTTAHAEERLVDRLFATADLLGLDSSVKYNKFLRNVW